LNKSEVLNQKITDNFNHIEDYLNGDKRELEILNKLLRMKKEFV